MPVNVTVRQVRDALFRQSRESSADETAATSTRLLGTLFHQVFAGLVGGTGESNWSSVLGGEPPQIDAWRVALRQHAYDRLVGPRLAQHQAALQECSEQVCLFWEGVVELCDWICELAWTVRQATGELPDCAELVESERCLELQLKQPEWTEAVRLTGSADAVWRIPRRGTWCVAELKLGRGHDEADLGQACLYHLILHQDQEQEQEQEQDSSPNGSLALVSFRPQRVEKVYSAEHLDEAQARLLDLIGRLAGVAPEPREPATDGEAFGTADDSASPQPQVSLPARPLVLPQPTEHHRQLGAALLAALREYDAPVELADQPIVGPAFLRFPIRPARGVRVRKIEGLAEEIRVRLGLEQPPFITSESGQLAVDIQRPDRQMILFSSIRDQLPGISPAGCSQLAVGVDLAGRLQFADLAQPEHCHLLVAGTTGSGKSEWLRAAIAGLVQTNTAETLRLVLIDPKRHAFNDLADSPLLLEPIVYPDEQDVVGVLQRVAEEMERRYAVMDGADTLEQHARRGGAALPRIVCVCDEYFDLVNRGRKQRAKLEAQIFRLGAKARAAGIHLILATQQPSREVIRGALDANINARVALKTNKAIESRMLLGEDGAAWLLGQGDLLFKDIGPPRRLQGVYVPPEQRAAVFCPDATGTAEQYGNAASDQKAGTHGPTTHDRTTHDRTTHDRT